MAERKKTRPGRVILAAAILLIALFLLFSSHFVVHPHEYGIVRQFGAETLNIIEEALQPEIADEIQGNTGRIG